MMTPQELNILAAARTFKKKRDASYHIGRDVTDAEWQEVCAFRTAHEAEMRRRAAIRRERAARKAYTPMIPAWKRLENRRAEETRKAKLQAQLAKAEAEMKLAQEIDATLKLVARAARKMGFEIRKSTDRGGRVSSYYATRNNKRPIRISDHELPATGKREFLRDCHGGASPFVDQIIIDKKLTATRIRRMLVLAERGRL